VKRKKRGGVIPEDSVIRKGAAIPIRPKKVREVSVSKRGRKVRAGDVLFGYRFSRQSYPIHDFVSYGLAIMAKRRKVTTGVLVSYILTRVVLDRLDEVPVIDHKDQPKPSDIPGAELLKSFFRK